MQWLPSLVMNQLVPHMENPPEMAAKYLNTAYFIQEHSLNRGVRRNTFIIFNFFVKCVASLQTTTLLRV